MTTYPMPDGGSISINEREFYRTFQSENGPFGKHLLRRSRHLEVAARIQAGKDTLKLIHNIDTFIYHGPGRDLYARVGVNPRGDTVGYAIYHHEGTRPHEILPIPPNTHLKFPANHGNPAAGYVYRTRVYHPGTRPNRYLTDNLREAYT